MVTIAMIWLLCFAVFLEMAYRAPVIDDWFN
jgi:hypothetical protein